jgi:hypothetical protein
MGSLAGGKKDVTPPRLISSKPVNYSTNFKSQKIEIEFDEFIALKNVNQELIMSPPLPKKPDVRIKNKSIVIDLKNELRENTTYTMNFGKSLTDNNEGNALTNFEFVFSTGNYLDSLSVKGNVVNAFNLQPSKEPIIVGLYDQTEDSIPLKSIPVYIGKTDDKGNFQINNIKSDTFKLFALKDLNYNLLFDLSTEEIAFIDTLITLTPDFLKSLPQRLSESDSVKKDTLTLVKPIPNEIIHKNAENDSVSMAKISLDNPLDSLKSDTLQRKPVLPSLYVDLFSFLQQGSKYYMSSKDRLNPESFQITFSLPLKENPPLNIINYDGHNDWNFPEINARRDTFIYWITDTTLMKKDTLMFEITYPMSDSTGVVYAKKDTIKFYTRKALPKPVKSKSATKPSPNKFILSTVHNKSLLDLNKDVSFNFNYPLHDIDTSMLHLYEKIDTIEVRKTYEIVYDSLTQRRVFLKSKWKEQNKYRIEAFPGAFTDIYYHTNDTLLTTFSLQDKSFYGTLTVTFTGINTPVLVQLMNEKENVLRMEMAYTNGGIIFDFLPPSKYKLKFVYDVNRNKQWDTGNYLRKIQPEKVRYYEGEINIRSNWDLEVKQDMEGK